MKNIPIITRDVFPFHKEDKDWAVAAYSTPPFTTPHEAFFNALFNEEKPSGIESPLMSKSLVDSLPDRCLKIEEYWFGKNYILDLDSEDDLYVNYPIDDERYPAHFQGIYFCLRSYEYSKNNYTHEIVYIGKTSDIKQSFTPHHKIEAFKLLDVDRVLFATYNPDHYTESDICWAEQQYIDMLKPTLNRDDFLCLGNKKQAKGVEPKQLAANGRIDISFTQKYFDTIQFDRASDCQKVQLFNHLINQLDSLFEKKNGYSPIKKTLPDDDATNPNETFYDRMRAFALENGIELKTMKVA